jgi:hypothetical protein
MEPESLTYRHQDEQRLIDLDHVLSFGFHHLFVRSDLSPAIVTSIRKLSEVHTQMTTRVQPSTPLPKSELLSVEIKRYCKEKRTETTKGDKRSTQWSEETYNEQYSKLALFMEIIGDKPVLEITNADYDLYIDTLRKLPVARHTNKETRGKSIEELMKMNATSVISAGTIIQYHGTVKAFVSWLESRYQSIGKVNTSIKDALKASGIHKQAANKQESRTAFTGEHISLMFESDRVIDFLSSSKIGPAEKAWKLFLPVLGATTGARLNELCSFLLADIGEEDGIDYLDMNLDNDEKKSLKNKNAKRRIPIHPVIKQLGFLQYVEYMRSLHTRKTNGRLFPDLKAISGHGYRKYATDWFNQEFLVHLGIKTRKLNFHSFRWYVLGILQRKARPDTTWRIDRYVGHEHGRKEPESIRTYLGKSLSDTVPVLDDLEFSVNWARYADLCRKTYR